MIRLKNMPARLNRALQVRTADRLRTSLARDAVSGLPVVGALSDADERELSEAGGGRLAAVVLCVAWDIDPTFLRRIHQVQSRVMTEVARLVDGLVRRTDLLGSLREDALVLLAPALDSASGRTLTERLRQLFAGRQLAVGDVQIRLQVKIGVAYGSSAHPAGWTTHSLAQDAERNASELPPIAIGA